MRSVNSILPPPLFDEILGGALCKQNTLDVFLIFTFYEYFSGFNFFWC